MIQGFCLYQTKVNFLPWKWKASQCSSTCEGRLGMMRKWSASVDVIHMLDSLPFCKGRQPFWLSICFQMHHKAPSEKGCTLQSENFLFWSNFFPFGVNLYWKEGQNHFLQSFLSCRFFHLLKHNCTKDVSHYRMTLLL